MVTLGGGDVTGGRQEGNSGMLVKTEQPPRPGSWPDIAGPWCSPVEPE